MKKPKNSRFLWADGDIQFSDEERTDWNPDQERDEKGRWAPAGGGGAMGVNEKGPGSAKEAMMAKAGTGTREGARLAANVEAMNKAKYSGPAEAAKALAGREAGVAEYQKQLAGQTPGSMPPDERDRRLANMARQAEVARNQSEMRLGLDPRSIVTGEDLRSQYPEPRGTDPRGLPGQLPLPNEKGWPLGEGTVGGDKQGAEAALIERAQREAVENRIAQAVKEHRGLEVPRPSAPTSAPNTQPYGTETMEKMIGSKMAAELKTPEPTPSSHHSEDPYGDHETVDTKPLMASAVLGAEPPPQNPTAERHANETERAELAQRQIVSAKVNGNAGTGNSSASWKVTLDDGSKAIWKPEAGEQEGVRDGVLKGEGYIREAAASAVAGQLGVGDMAPGTVVHEHTDKNGTAKGALQSYMNGESLRYAGIKFNREDSEKMRVFDYVAANSDRHNGNVLYKEDNDGEAHPVLIDHGLTFPHATSDRFIQPWREIDHSEGPLLPATREQISKIDVPKLAQTLYSNGIDKESIRLTAMRAYHLKDHPEVLQVDYPGMEHDNGSHSMYHWDSLIHKDLTPEYGVAANKVMKGLTK